MVSKTNEQALEATIQRKLTGTSLEELQNLSPSDLNENLLIREQVKPSNENHGYELGLARDFDPNFALDLRCFWYFLETTQKEELEKLKSIAKDWRQKILERFDRIVKKDGLLQVLKKGLSVDNAKFYLMYPAPLASSGDKVKQNFDQNIFSCTRQVTYSKLNPLEEVDMLLFINGIPIVTLELKNPWTGQNAKYHGIRQYKKDRDISQPLFNFARALVHFAVDTDEIYMSTKLAGEKTFFLPFNKGNNGGAGNPVNPNGHKSSYLWEEIFSPLSLANIIQNYMRLDGNSKSLDKSTLFFPRYHQLDVVNKLKADVSLNGAGKRYLIQHSAGSGKSNSITWLAFQLLETYQQKDDSTFIPKPVFDSVIVVTDRKVLDKQLRKNIKSFSEVKNIISAAHKASELKDSLEQGKKIIITTIQKFPFIIEGISDLSEKKFAVIIDEAHSSQSGSAHDNMNRVIGAQNDLDIQDAQDKILEAMKSRKMRDNASYFAFTATPKNTTLEKFGVKNADGSFEPFHLYTMKQAIEEGFILDVLANYTTYKSYYEIQKSIEDNPLFDTKKAQKKLKAFVERNPSTISVKAEIITEHFMTQLINNKKLKGKARAMLITQDIESAITYYQAISKQLEQRGTQSKALIAFSGSKKVKGIEYTEASINGFSEDKTKEYFDGFDENGRPIIHNGNSIENTYRILVVANKYLTGFDQPKLTAMYVDKKLQGVLCVQALSRLNRAAPNLGKKTEDLFVLDFFNSVDDIKKSFDNFYTSTSLSEATDINVLHELKESLDDVPVYEDYEVNNFIDLYFSNAEAQDLSPIIDKAAHRFNLELCLEDAEKADFKIKAKQFVKIYGQMAAIMPFEVIEWEKLFWFLKFLIPKLIVKDPNSDKFDELLNSIDLSTYALERNRLNYSIELDPHKTELDPQNPNPRSAHQNEEDKDSLEQIIESFNEKWFHGWAATPEQQKVKFVNLAEMVKKHPDFKEKYKSNSDIENREIAYKKIFDDVLADNRKNDLDFYKRVTSDSAFKVALMETLKKMHG